MEGHRSLIGSLFFNTVLKGRIHVELKLLFRWKKSPHFFLVGLKAREIMPRVQCPPGAFYKCMYVRRCPSVPDHTWRGEERAAAKNFSRKLIFSWEGGRESFLAKNCAFFFSAENAGCCWGQGCGCFNYACILALKKKMADHKKISKGSLINLHDIAHLLCKSYQGQLSHLVCGKLNHVGASEEIV